MDTTKKTWDPSDVGKKADDDKVKAAEAKKADEAKAKDDDKAQDLDRPAAEGRATHVTGEGDQAAQVDTETGRVVEPDPATGGVKPEDQPVPDADRPTATWPMNDPRNLIKEPKPGMPGYVDRDAEKLKEREEQEKAAKSSKK